MTKVKRMVIAGVLLFSTGGAFAESKDLESAATQANAAFLEASTLIQRTASDWKKETSHEIIPTVSSSKEQPQCSNPNDSVHCYPFQHEMICRCVPGSHHALEPKAAATSFNPGPYCDPYRPSCHCPTRSCIERANLNE